MAYKETILDKIIRLCNGGLNNSSISKKDVLKSILAAISNYSEEPVSEDLEAEIKRYLHEVHDRDTTVGDVARHFANWQKEQMMANAIDGHVGQTINGMLRALSDETFGDMGFTAGDKVKLIIIKED